MNYLPVGVRINLLLLSHNLVFNQDQMTPGLWILIFLIHGLDAGSPGGGPSVVHGNWGSWQSWSRCSRTCGGGSQKATRKCNNPAPSGGGSGCSGRDTMTQRCNTQACPVVHGNWGSWQSWSQCSMTCGGGSQSASRRCNNPAPGVGGRQCSGQATKTQGCNTQACPTTPAPCSRQSLQLLLYRGQRCKRGQRCSSSCGGNQVSGGR